MISYLYTFSIIFFTIICMAFNVVDLPRRKLHWYWPILFCAVLLSAIFFVLFGIKLYSKYLVTWSFYNSGTLVGHLFYEMLPHVPRPISVASILYSFHSFLLLLLWSRLLLVLMLCYHLHHPLVHISSSTSLLNNSL